MGIPHGDKPRKDTRWDNFYAVELYEQSATINPYPRISDRMMGIIRESFSLMEVRDEFRDLYSIFNKYWLQESIGRYFRLMQKTSRKAEWGRIEYKESDFLMKFGAIEEAMKEWHEEACRHNGENTSGILRAKLHKTPTLDKPGIYLEKHQSNSGGFSLPTLSETDQPAD